jgi:hypothetical protein
VQVFNALAGYRKAFDVLADGLRNQIAKLDQLQLAPALASSLKAAASNDLLGVDALRGDHEALRKLLQLHPLAAAKPAILNRGYFIDANEFNFALAEEFARLVLQDATDTGWRDLLKMPPRWTNDPERAREVQTFGQAAVGLQLLKANKTEARQELIEAGKKHIAILQDRYRKAMYFAPLPYWTDQVLLEFALAAALADPAPDYEFILQAQLVLNRSIETSPDDALTNLAVQPSAERRRISQSSLTIQYQQIDRERRQLSELVKRLLSSTAREVDVVIKERRNDLSIAEDFIRQQQRLHGALAAAGGEDVGSVTRLTTVKELLLADEALVFHVPALGQLGKICVRQDRAWSSTQVLDAATVARDARLVSAALTAAHPPSNTADSEYPAAEAVRLRNVLFGGLEECMRASKRIYVLTTVGVLGQVPPAALLIEAPPVMGSGFDLRAAHWLIRDHSFVRINSVNAFVATKRLSRTRKASLDYLGVGDPILAQLSPAQPSGGQLVARGSVPAQSGPVSSLPELPEASEELGRVARLFDAGKARVLRRENANEESFRLEPLSEFDVIHFATHGLIREEQPGLREPSLVLTPEPNGDQLNDGLLTASQIAALPLRARLVVLSACNSARYDPTVFDGGIQGLSTSFAVAGVPSMIAALWPIESTLTRDLIIATFQAARAGNMAVADALAVAVRKHLDGPAPRPLLHPRFWAALVVVGDGSIALGSSAAPPSRDLGPYAPINSTDGDEILFAAALDGDFITSTIGAWNGKRSPSLIRRRPLDGATKWEVKDGEIGAGPVAASKDVVYAGGYLSFPDGTLVRNVPVLRRISRDGAVLWSKELPGPARNTFVMGLSTTGPDRSALALIGPQLGEESGTTFDLKHIDKSGNEIANLAMNIGGDARWGVSGHLAAHENAALAVMNRSAYLKAEAQGFDWLGNVRFCWDGDAAEVFLIDVPALKVERRISIDRFHAGSALAVDGGWILVGSERDECRRDRHAAAYSLNADGTVRRLWRDTSPFDTFARGIRRARGVTEIVGYTRRSIAIREQIAAVTTPDFSIKRWGDEPYISGEIFSVRLNGQGTEEGRDFLAAGFPLVPMGMVSTGDHSAIFGTITSRALWMPQ